MPFGFYKRSKKSTHRYYDSGESYSSSRTYEYESRSTYDRSNYDGSRSSYERSSYERSGQGGDRDNNEYTYSVSAKARMAPSTLSASSASTYDAIKAECLQRGCLWEDPSFPCNASNIYYKHPPSVWPDIEWKRPGEISRNPQLFVDGASVMDVNQGILGDCWLLAAVAGLATEEKLLHHVIPDNQSFVRGEYAGIFRFNIWQYGRWVEVLIDDRLPTTNNRLIYMHAESRDEFWSALLEKAYAKVAAGCCYESLTGGQTSEAMTDFTGGLVARIELRDKAPEDLFRKMLRARQRASLMGCSIDASEDCREQKLDNGLIIGHAYTITDVRTIDTDSYGQLSMVRVRNPWGDEHEWKGAWGDGSAEWRSLSREERASLGLRFAHDGEFWMNYDDWVREFERLELCFLGPETMGESATFNLNNETFSGQLLEGVWRRNATAGGCRNYPQTFHTNPQYHTKLSPEAAEDDGLVTAIVAVMQKGGRKAKKIGGDNLPVSYAIYEVESGDTGTLDARWFRTHKVAVKAPVFVNSREVAEIHRMPPGNYVIVPSTFEPNQEAEFILRLYSEQKQTVKEIEETSGSNPPSMVLQDTVDDMTFLAEIRRLFDRASGDDREISAYELQDIFREIFSKEMQVQDFSIDMCRSIVAVYDADFSGKLDFEDFKHLCEILKIAKKTFKAADDKNEGWFSGFELRSILKQLGLRISNQTTGAIVMRYSDKEGRVHFDDFLLCVVKLSAAFEHYKRSDPDGDGQCVFAMEDLIQLIAYS